MLHLRENMQIYYFLNKTANCYVYVTMYKVSTFESLSVTFVEKIYKFCCPNY